MDGSQQPSPLMLSVSGMRGIVGGSLTPEVLTRYGMAIGCWLKAEAAEGSGLRVAVGRDSRVSGEMVEMAVVSGLLAVGCGVVRLGVVSTPGVGVVARSIGCIGSVVITASHNPAPWNGVKVLRADGAAPSAAEASALIERFERGDFEEVGHESVGRVADHPGPVAVHVDRVLAEVDVQAVREAGLRAVVDSTCGAGGEAARRLLEALGVGLVHLHAEPTGLFPHPPEPTEENLKELCSVVAREGVDVGFAQDTDADRLALVDETGRYIGEEYTLALCARHLLERSDADGEAGVAGGVVAANLSTSRMVDDVVAASGVAGARVVRSAVGEANVVTAMLEAGGVIGGEGNGGIIWDRIGRVRDSIAGMALVCEMLAARKRGDGATLSAIVAERPAYAMVKAKVAADAGLIARLDEVLPGAFPEAAADTQDGVRLDWPDCWVHVRASNTEPIVRLIAEARDLSRAEALVSAAERALGLTG
ncbi:MAG: phosphoglucosamine mutase [Planctomycetota bacterium]